ncbi:MAG: hypothetical protein JWR35_614 [Marmoricola sp.]|nr:hypothetical protein [Marmoricola sp.]
MSETMGRFELTCSNCDLPVCGLIRVPNGFTHESGSVNTYPRVWLLDNDAQGRDEGPVSSGGLRRWHVKPSPDRVLTSTTEAGLTPVCPKCKAKPWPDGLGWERLTPILDTLLDTGVRSIALTGLRSTLS